MTSIDQLNLKNYLVTHNYKRYIKIYTLIMLITSILLLIISCKYKYDIKEEYLAKKLNTQVSFEIDNNKIMKIEKYNLIINDEELEYKIINVEQGIEKSIITIQPEKQRCDSNFCKIILTRKNITLKNEIIERIKEMI